MISNGINGSSSQFSFYRTDHSPDFFPGVNTYENNATPSNLAALTDSDYSIIAPALRTFCARNSAQYETLNEHFFPPGTNQIEVSKSDRVFHNSTELDNDLQSDRFHVQKISVRGVIQVPVRWTDNLQKISRNIHFSPFENVEWRLTIVSNVLSDPEIYQKTMDYLKGDTTHTLIQKFIVKHPDSLAHLDRISQDFKPFMTEKIRQFLAVSDMEIQTDLLKPANILSKM